MFKGNKNLIVGLFVSLAVAALVAFSLWLSGRTTGEALVRYSMLFEKDVSGLVIGGPVKYMGVNIGSVMRMQLEHRDEIMVRVDIEVVESAPINSGTYAGLAFQGITGAAVINLARDAGSHPPIEPTPGFEYPLIPVRAIGMAALLADAPQITAKLGDLLDQANMLLGEDNRAALNGALKNVESLTQSLAANEDAIAALPGDLHETLGEIRGTVGHLQGILGKVQPDIVATLENFNNASQNLAALTHRFDQWMANHEADMEHLIDDGLADAPALIADARRTLREMEKLMKNIQDDPSQLIHRSDEESLHIDP
jgi:phospholipid/cholesterol/gamma-HCH transport system substrate-binding protein